MAGGVTVAAGTLELHTEFYMGNGASGVFNIGNNATLAVSGWIDNYTFNNVTLNFQGAGGGTFTAIGNGSDYLNWYLTSGMTVQTAGGRAKPVQRHARLRPEPEREQRPVQCRARHGRER